MIVSPAVLGSKSDYVGEGQQQFTRQFLKGSIQTAAFCLRFEYLSLVLIKVKQIAFGFNRKFIIALQFD
jgi:hypothetical protein